MNGSPTPGGSRLVRNVAIIGERAIDGAGRFLEEIEAHVEAHVGPIAAVLHEIESEFVHLDLLVIAPSERAPFTTVVTAGMSDRAMHAPDALKKTDEWRHCELMLGLPADWNGGQYEDWTEESFAPLVTLKQIARYPHAHHAWIGPHHSVPIEGGRGGFGGLYVGWPYAFAPELARLSAATGETVNFYGLYFITPKELSLKLAKGSQALEDALLDNDVTIEYRPGRRCVAPRKGWLWSVG